MTQAVHTAKNMQNEPFSLYVLLKISSTLHPGASVLTRLSYMSLKIPVLCLFGQYIRLKRSKNSLFGCMCWVKMPVLLLEPGL